MCGFGLVHPLPGIAPGVQLNTAITLPVGVEAYGAYALGAWLTVPAAPDGDTGAAARTARTFAARSAIGALALGCLGQVVYHLLAAAHAARAPWPVVALVSCLPVVSLALGAALAHLMRAAADEARAGAPVAAAGPLSEPAAPGPGGRAASSRWPGPALGAPGPPCHLARSRRRCRRCRPGSRRPGPRTGSAWPPVTLSRRGSSPPITASRAARPTKIAIPRGRAAAAGAGAG